MQNIEQIIKEELSKLGFVSEEVTLTRPKHADHGDYAFFVKDASIDLASLALEKVSHEYIKSCTVLGRFINIHLSDTFLIETLKETEKQGTEFGKNNVLTNKRIIFEYTDPNPFKQFHIGHLMSNAIGETLSRLAEYGGAEVKRANYQGDVGLHVAKAIWGMQELSGEMSNPKAELSLKATFLGKAYTHGSNSYEDDESVKKEIDALNKKIFEKSDEKVQGLYEWGRKVSLDYFEIMYTKLGTRFDYYFFESETAGRGTLMVEEFLKKGIFEKSDGAVIFRGEQYGLHTRVFITSQGLPTYETKEIGLNLEKFDRGNFDESVIVTASEQNDYFSVVLKALEFIDSNVANRTRHIGHGMLRFASGKMSSRKGNVITGESLIVDVEKLVYEKIKDRELLSDRQKQEVVEQVAIGAVKYSILKQSPGRDIVFDMEKSLSFEGDSGPYLQYAHARACSVLEKAQEAGIEASFTAPEASSTFERLLSIFPDVVKRAERERAPQLIVTYLIDLAGIFNNYYAHNPIVVEGEAVSAYRVALTKSFKTVMNNGLYLLGIQAPERM